MIEIWKQIVDYPNYYISNFGNIKRNDRLKQTITDKGGYKVVQLFNRGNQKIFKIHRLVGGAFLENPENKPFIDHIDFDRTNNVYTNLRWVDRIESQQHRQKTINKKSSKYKGVSFVKRENKWKAQISINKKPIYIGSFKTEIECATAYNSYIKEYNLEKFFILNVII